MLIYIKENVIVKVSIMKIVTKFAKNVMFNVKNVKMTLITVLFVKQDLIEVSSSQNVVVITI